MYSVKAQFSLRKCLLGQVILLSLNRYISFATELTRQKGKIS